jgi:hypothetical protein
MQMSRLEHKRRFIKQLAVFLAGDSARKSIELQMKRQSAVEWSDLRSTTPLSGWVTVEDAEKILEDFLL